MPDNPEDFDPDKTMQEPRRSPEGEPATLDPDGGTVEIRRERVRSDLEATLILRDQRGPVASEESGPPAVFEVVCLSGEARGRRFPLRNDECVLGSNAGCDVIIPEADVIHAKLSRTEDGFEVMNVGDDESIVLSGGRSADHAALTSGDLLRVSGVVLRFAKVGDVFSSDYSDHAFEPTFLGRLAGSGGGRSKRLYLVIAVLAAAVVLLLLTPPREATRVETKKAGPTDADLARQKEVESLLSAGEVLFNEGRLFTSPDRPGGESAFGKFNDALALDPGNATALAFLKRIDEQRDQQRRAREEAEKQRLAAEQAKRDRARKEIDDEIAAILREGDELFRQGKVAEPVGRNALVKYREALTVDADSRAAKDRIARVIAHYVDRGDAQRDADDPWAAIENYRKASRVTEGKNPDVEARVRDTEARLRSTLSPGSARVVMYKDERGRLFVLDDPDKVPARYKDRAVVVEPQA